jgi:hypothetical protein
MSIEQAIQRTMEATGWSRKRAIKEIQKAMKEGKLTPIRHAPSEESLH